MTVQVRAIAPDGAPSPLGKARARSGLGPDGRVSTIAGDFDLTALMRAENVIEVRWNRALDRFTVILGDYRCGGGATVGEALANAQRRAA